MDSENEVVKASLLADSACLALAKLCLPRFSIFTLTNDYQKFERLYLFNLSFQPPSPN